MDNFQKTLGLFMRLPAWNLHKLFTDPPGNLAFVTTSGLHANTYFNMHFLFPLAKVASHFPCSLSMFLKHEESKEYWFIPPGWDFKTILLCYPHQLTVYWYPFNKYTPR